MKIKPYKPQKNKFFPEKKVPADGDAGVERVNRTVYLTVAVLLIVLAVAVAMTSAANRAKKGSPSESGTSAASRTPAITRSPAATQGTPDPAGADSKDPNSAVAKVVPTMALPVFGSLGTLHDPSIQVFSDTLGEWRVHLGVDFMTEAGAAVSAAAAGTVEKVGSDPLMGTYVSIRHDGGAVTVYKNLADQLADGIAEGAKVSAGQLLGTVGETALMELAEDPHLHFEMTVGGEPVDPLAYFSTDSLRSLEASVYTSYEAK